MSLRLSEMSETNESPPATRTDEAKKRPVGTVGRAAKGFSLSHAFAVEIAVDIIAPMLIGWWLDSKTGKEPWFMIGGMILGAGAVARSVQRFYRESQEDNKEGAEPSDTERPE